MADDTIDIPIPTGEKKMAVDLADNVAQMLLNEGAASHQQGMADIRGNTAVAHNLARLSATRRFDEVDTMEGRAVSGVNATPLAGPTSSASGG